MLIDTHCHLFEEYYKNIDEIIKNFGKDNYLIVAGVDEKTSLEVIKLCDKYTNVFGVIGVHPSEIKRDISLDFIVNNINHPKVVGVGEIGLDYYWVKDNKELQRKIFIQQLEIAKKNDKPVVIHARESIQDMYDILKNYPDLKKVLHSYSGSVEMAKKFVSINTLLGINGIVTFKNAKNIIEVVKHIPLENIVLETDAPYLTPEPFRGYKNEPKNVWYVAEKIAEIKGLEYHKIIEITSQNAIKEFDLATKI